MQDNTAPQQQAPTPTNPSAASLAALKAALQAAASAELVTPEENAKRVKTAKKEAAKLLAELRGEPVSNFFDIDSEDRAVPENGGNCRCCGGKGEHDTGKECYGCDGSGLDRGYAGPNPCDGTKEDNSPRVLAINANITPDEQRQIDLATEQFKQSVQRVDNQILAQYVQAVQDGDYSAAEKILENAQESQQVNTLMFALLTIGAILLPLYAKQRLQALYVHYGMQTVYAQTTSGQAAMKKQAERGAKSHVNTIAKDIKKSLDDAIADELTNPEIRAALIDKYEQLGGDDDKKYKAAVLGDQDIYAYARDLILKGESRNTVIKKLQENFSSVGKRRAITIAGNEANRVFTMSQFDADQQFLAQNKLTEKAYKRLVSNTGHPEAICKYIIDKTHAHPIPFTQDFVPFGKTLTVTDNGKTYKFKANYEKLQSGHIHVNCHCRYELLIKQDDGTFVNTYDWKVLNNVPFEEDKHKRDKDGKFAKKASSSSIDLNKLGDVKSFNKHIEDAYWSGEHGHYDEATTDGVRAYQGHFYDAINEHARKNQLDDPLTIYGTDTTYGGVMSDIDRAGNITLSADATLYRGTEHPMHKSAQVGDTISLRSFLSTSTDQKVAEKFKYKGGSMLVITAKKGQKVILPDLVTFGKRGKTMGEAEVLGTSNSRLMVTKIDGDTVYAEMS